jgi:hypothetical protein
VPREYLEQFNIRGRVRLEAVEEGILIRPVGSGEAEPGERAQAGDLTADTPQAKLHGLRGWWENLRHGRRLVQ